MEVQIEKQSNILSDEEVISLETITNLLKIFRTLLIKFSQKIKSTSKNVDNIEVIREESDILENKTEVIGKQSEEKCSSLKEDFFNAIEKVILKKLINYLLKIMFGFIFFITGYCVFKLLIKILG